MGIVGLPNVGKSTIFNALTGGAAQVANYPFTTIDANVGVVELADERLRAIARITAPEKLTPATVEFIDIAGLVEGASRGEGLGNQFLAKIREVDAICHVLRCFEETDVTHVSGRLAPLEDLSVVDTEFRLADLEVIERRLEKAGKKAKGGEKEERRAVEILEAIRDAVSAGRNLRELDLDDRGAGILDELSLLILKPVLYVLNVDEEYAGDARSSPCYVEVEAWADRTGARLVGVSAKIESEIAALPHDERTSFAEELGIGESALVQLVRESKELLHLVTFYTIKGSETRAWNIRAGSTAVEAAGKIHSDIARGFIKAEVVKAENLIECGSMAKAREEGLVQIEGKDYTVRDGDVLLIKFNVS